MTLSIIIPVYNRPDEVDELLASLSMQSGDFEVIIVEDGSTLRCEDVVDRYSELSNIRYFFIANSGPGQARNYGSQQAQGEYFIFLDSDTIVPEGWIDAVANALPADAFGGPDRAAATFTPLQKAIDYAMTSPLTTGGIRGRGHSIDRFYPRSFNMGVRRAVFEAVGGFGTMRFGEDIDLSYRIVEAGYDTKLAPEAWVYHKRRTRWRQFFKQVFNSGTARVALSKRHRGTLKMVHLLPSVFVVGCVAILVMALWWPCMLAILGAGMVVLFIDAMVRTRSVKVGALSALASVVQLTGYGSGFLWALGGGGAMLKKFYS